MKATYQTKTYSTWLQSTDPVVPVNPLRTSTPSVNDSLSALRTALSKGVCGVPDGNRMGFYEIEIGDDWYYIHIPDRRACIYLIAATQKQVASFPVLVSSARQ
jgi:hypothetical protein